MSLKSELKELVRIRNILLDELLETQLQIKKISEKWPTGKDVREEKAELKE